MNIMSRILSLHSSAYQMFSYCDIDNSWRP